MVLGTRVCLASVDVKRISSTYRGYEKTNKRLSGDPGSLREPPKTQLTSPCKRSMHLVQLLRCRGLPITACFLIFYDSPQCFQFQNGARRYDPAGLGLPFEVSL